MDILAWLWHPERQFHLSPIDKMTVLTRFLILLFASAFLGACGNTFVEADNLDPNVAMRADSRTTVVVYSQLAKGGESRVFFRDPELHKAGGFTATQGHPMVQHDLSQGEYQGDLKVMALRGSGMEFYRFHWQSATDVLERTNWNARVELKPRQVIYIGRFLIGRQGTQARLEVVDASAEDLAKFRQMYPKLADVESQTQLLKQPYEAPQTEEKDTYYLP